MKTKVSEMKRIERQIDSNQKVLDDLRSRVNHNDFNLETITLLEECIDKQLERINNINKSLLN